MKKNDDTKYQIHALVKGLNILDCFQDYDEFSITELAHITDMPGSSVQRIVNTFEFMGYLYQNPDNKKYRLTPKMLQFTTKCSRFVKWREQSRKHMVELNGMFGESVNLAVRNHDKCAYIELVESKHLLRPNFTFNDSYPLYCTVLGRSLLCDLPDEMVMAILPESIPQLTPYTNVDRQEVLKIIKETRGKKYSIDDEEFYLGLCCVGGPVFGVGNKVVAALSVTAPKVRMTPETIARLIPAVIDTARKISAEYIFCLADRPSN